MIKSLITSIFILIYITSYAQGNDIKIVTLQFKRSKSPVTAQFSIDYANKKLACMSILRKDTVFNKTYSFTNNQFEKLKTELDKDIPDSIVSKSRDMVDGGGFIITYFRGNSSSKLIVGNPTFDAEFAKELQKISAFFEFGYSIVKDSGGIDILDINYQPYFRGLPVRKISDSPLEYKIWGSMSGDHSPALTAFLDNLSHDKCVIINCANNLSYALQEDILTSYIIKGSNLKFINNDYLKYTRENIIKLKKQLKDKKKDAIEFKRNTTYQMYVSNSEDLDRWLKLSKRKLKVSLEEARRNCN